MLMVFYVDSNTFIFSYSSISIIIIGFEHFYRTIGKSTALRFLILLTDSIV
jgi:hypothetical protein